MLNSRRDFEVVLEQVAYPGMRFVVDHFSLHGPTMYLQVVFEGPCNITGQPNIWSGRKWYLSPHMTPSEVVQTAMKAVLTALEHEARERFTYRGQPIFQPHYNIDALVELCENTDATQHHRLISPVHPDVSRGEDQGFSSFTGNFVEVVKRVFGLERGEIDWLFLDYSYPQYLKRGADSEREVAKRLRGLVGWNNEGWR